MLIDRSVVNLASLNGRASPTGRARPFGFTMVELIVVMVLLGILGAVAAPRLLGRQDFDAGLYADHAKSVIRLAQKFAVSQRRTITVVSGTNFVGACYDNPCTAANVVRAPGGQNSNSSGTQAACRINGVYIAHWLCEGAPANVVLNNGGVAAFSFDASGAPSTGVVLSTSGKTITVEAVTGYVH